MVSDKTLRSPDFEYSLFVLSKFHEFEPVCLATI